MVLRNQSEDQVWVSFVNREYWSVAAEGDAAVVAHFEKLGVLVRIDESLSLRKFERVVSDLTDGELDFARAAFGFTKRKSLRLIYCGRSDERDTHGRMKRAFAMLVFRVPRTKACALLLLRGKYVRQMYGCYDSSGRNLIEGSPIGSKERIRAWAREKFGACARPEMISAELFFSPRDCEYYECSDGRAFAICEVWND